MGRVDFALPDVGEGLEEGEVVSWLVAPGETVARDQPLVEVQTDKALVELPSPVAGQVVSLAFAPGDIVKVGQVLVVLDDGRGGEVAPAAVAASSAGGDPPGGTVPGAAPARRPRAAPAVRRLALERGVDLAAVVGTGPGGRILAADVEAASARSATGVPRAAGAEAATGLPRATGAEAGSAVSPAGGAGPEQPEPGTAASTAPGPETGGADRLGWMEPGRHPLRGIRRVTAEAMARSWSEIPHLTTMDEVDATGLLAARGRLAEAGIDATIGALLVAAVARGLRRHPLLNASLEPGPPAGPSAADTDPSAGAASAGAASAGAGSVVVHEDRNVGLAVATADGLVVPVIRRADRLRLPDLAAEVRRLTAAARARRVDLSDLRGGTFTVTNYGSLGGRFATPLIRPPEVGIMGFGAIRPRPLVVDGEVRARPTLPWCLSVDHRLLDGDVATAFSTYVTGLLADPVALLAEMVAGP